MIMIIRKGITQAEQHVAWIVNFNPLKDRQSYFSALSVLCPKRVRFSCFTMCHKWLWNEESKSLPDVNMRKPRLCQCLYDSVHADDDPFLSENGPFFFLYPMIACFFSLIFRRCYKRPGPGCICWCCKTVYTHQKCSVATFEFESTI